MCVNFWVLSILCILKFTSLQFAKIKNVDNQHCRLYMVQTLGLGNTTNDIVHLLSAAAKDIRQLLLGKLRIPLFRIHPKILNGLCY